MLRHLTFSSGFCFVKIEGFRFMMVHFMRLYVLRILLKFEVICLNRSGDMMEESSK